MISIFTTFTKPELRNDPWKEALDCYFDFSDEVIVTGTDWPEEFKWKQIGKYFQDGFNKSKGDWVIRMDIDYFFHEKYLNKLERVLDKHKEFPAVSFPQYQFFSVDKFHLKTRLCVALNKKRFPEIKLNGGGDFCLATLDGKLIDPQKVPNVNIPIYQYDSMFRTKNVIAKDRARFARAWFNEFNNYGNRGGPEEDEAFNAWLNTITSKFKYHTNKFSIDLHPKYIKNKLKNLEPSQFGYNLFGHYENQNKLSLSENIKAKNEFYFGGAINNFKGKYFYF